MKFKSFVVAAVTILVSFQSGCTPPDEEPASPAESAADFVADPSSSSNANLEAPENWEPSQGSPSESETIDGEVVGDLDSISNAAPTFESLLNPVEELFQASRYEEAIAAAKEIRAKLPDDPRTLIVIANIASEMGRAGDLDGAIATLEGLPESATDQNIKMELLQHYQQKSQQTDDTELAIATIQKATAIVREIGMEQPWAKLFLFDEAALLAKAGKQDESAKVLREAYEAGYEEYVAPMASDAFADNSAAKAVFDEYAPILRERFHREIREEMAEFQSYPFSFRLTAVDGETVSTESMQGKVGIVDFWGTWCPPCRMEIPHFIHLTETFADDLEIVGLNYQEQGTEEEQAEQIRDFLSSNHVTYRCAIGDEETMAQVPEVRGFPTTVFLDRSGKVRLQLVGYHPYEKLEAAVKILADEAPAENESPSADEDEGADEGADASSGESDSKPSSADDASDASDGDD